MDWIELFPGPVSTGGILLDGALIHSGSQRRTQNPSSFQGTEGSFSIDSEEYEAMPVEVKLLPRKLQFFCDPRKRQQVLQSTSQ